MKIGVKTWVKTVEWWEEAAAGKSGKRIRTLSIGGHSVTSINCQN